MSHASNAAELSAKEAARQLLDLSPGYRSVERCIKGSAGWHRPKLLTAVLGQLAKRTSPTVAAAERARCLLDVLWSFRMEMNIFHYNGAINVCQKGGAWQLALNFLGEMPSRSIQPDHISYNAVLGACGEASAWQLVLRFLDEMPSNLISFNTAAKAFDRSGHWQLALRTLDLLRMTHFQPDLVSYGSVMNGLAAGGHWQKVGHLLQLMLIERLTPDLPCFTSYIKACGKEKKWTLATRMLLVMAEVQVVPDIISYSSAITSCSSQWPVAMALFHQVPMPDLPIFNTLMMSLSNRWRIAMQLLRQLPNLRLNSDEITRNLASQSYVTGTQWPVALWLHDFHPHPQLPPNILLLDHWSAALDVGMRFLSPETASQAAGPLTSAQKWQLALTIFQQMDLQMVQRDAQNWNDAVATCRRDAWPLALHALQALPALPVLPCEVGILGGDDGLEAFMKFRTWMSPAAVCGTLAKLLVNDPALIHSSLVAASHALDDAWSPQDVCTLWWSCAILGASNPALFRRLEEISLRLLHVLSAEGLVALAVGASAHASDESLHVGTAVLDALQEEMSLRLELGVHLGQEDILGVVSAFKLAGRVSRKLEEMAKCFLQQIAAKLDQTSVKDGGRTDLKMRRTSAVMDFSTGNASQPAVVLGLPDRAVLYKPPGWEVHDEHMPRQLRNFAAEAFPNKPILHDAIHNSGFLHRLDVPNSGLLLVATTYQAYYDLQLQLAAGDLGRAYLVLVHGAVPQRDFMARLHHDGIRSVAGGQGRPSQTKVVDRAVKNDRTFTLVHVEIVTGRQHQIRCHLAHVGHSVVCDGLYSSSETFRLDCGWCPRNWLHRWRLTFRDATGSLQQTSMALPKDLAETLDLQLRAAAES